jgi:hypothetical protein
MATPFSTRAQVVITANTAMSDSTACEGQRISAIEVENAIRPVASGARPAFLRPVLRALLGGVRTRADAVSPYVLLETGGICTNAKRREGERLVRSLRYIAAARFRALPDSDGVRIVVDASDDLRPIVGMTLDDRDPTSLTIGNINFFGTGTLVEGRWSDGGFFRDGYGFRYNDPTTFGRRAIFAAAIDRRTIGDRLSLSLAEPYLTRFQKIAWELSFREETEYVPLDRNVDDPSAWQVGWTQFNAGAVGRIALGGVQILAGGIYNYERITPADSGVIITASGLQPVTNAVLIDRYPVQDGARAGVIAGIRALDFTTVDALETVDAQHDMARGLQVASVIGRGISANDDRPFVAAEVYAGVGGERFFMNARVTAERRSSEGQMDAARLTSGRGAMYLRISARQVQELNAEFTGIWRKDLPTAVFLDDRVTGPRGFEGTTASGSRLLVGRFEHRLRIGGFGTAIGFGLAGFVDGAKLWAGDSPLGETTDAQFSAGAGFLVALPRNSRKTIRIDAAFPLTKPDGVEKFEVRLTVTTAGRRYWREPAGFQRSRIVPMLRSLLGWF